MEAIVLGPGEGDVISGTATVWIKALLDELALSESHYEAIAGGAALHLHRAHADAFYVLAGGLDMELGGERAHVPPGGFVLAPPGVTHSFTPVDPGTRFLNLHAPGADYAEIFRARLEGRSVDAERGDTFPPEGSSGTGTVVEAGEGELLEGDRRKLHVKVSRAELDVLEFEIEPGFEGPGAHYHREHVDSFYVLEGEVLFTVGGESVRAGPGAFVAAPPGVVHAFTASDRPARFLNVHAPDRGFTEYLRARARNEDVDPADYDICEIEEE